MGVINRKIRRMAKPQAATKSAGDWEPRYTVEGKVYKADQKKAKELGFPLQR